MTSPIVEPEARRDVVRRRVITVAVVLAALGLLVLAAVNTRRGDPEPVIQGTGIVEQFSPANGDDVLSQHPVSIDLTIDWEVVSLQIGTTLIQSSELVQRRELAQVIFEPGEGKSLQRLPAGEVCATATVKRVVDDASRTRPITWCFNVA